MSVRFKNFFRKRGTSNELTSCRRTTSKYLKEPLNKIKCLEEFPPLKRHCSQEPVGSCQKISDDDFGEGELLEGGMCFEEWRWQEYQQNKRGESYLECLFGQKICCPVPASREGAVASRFKKEYESTNEHIGGAWTPPRRQLASFVDSFSISTARAESIARSSADTTKQHMAPISALPPPLAISPNVISSPIQPAPTKAIPLANSDRPVKIRTIHTLISPSVATSAVTPSPVPTCVPLQSPYSLQNSWFLQLSDQFGFSKILSSLEPLFQEGNLYAESYGYPTVPCDIFGTMVVRKLSPMLSKRRDLKTLFSPYARGTAESKSLF